MLQAQALARQLARIEQQIEKDQAGPQKRFVSPATREAIYALYYDHLRRTIEARGMAVVAGIARAMALDPSDNDLLRIDASPLVLNCISAMLELGYQLQKVDVEKGYLQVPGKRSQSGCYQEFEFRPRQWLSGIKEVELSFIPDGADTLLLVEVDRSFRGDSYRTVRLSPQATSAQVQQALRGILG